MGKVIKISLRILSVIFITVIAVPILIGILLYIPTVQQFVINKATRIISEKLDTKVSLDGIHLKLFNKATLNGLYIEDYKQDTLLYAKKIAIGVNYIGLSSGRFVLSKVSLDNASFYLNHDSLGVSNLRYILNRLRSDKTKDRTKVFRLDARVVEVNNLSFRNVKLPEPRKGVNISDIDIRNFNLKVENISVINDSITAIVKNISLRDKSNFTINSLSSSKLTVSGSGIIFDDLDIVTPDTHLKMDYMRLISGTWSGYSNFMDSVKLEGQVVDSKVGLRTIGYFAPPLADIDVAMNNVNLLFWGPLSSIKGRLNGAKIRNTELVANCEIEGLPDVAKIDLDLNISKLSTTNSDIQFFIEKLTKSSVGGASKYLTHLNRVGLSGSLHGNISNFDVKANLNTSLGGLMVDMKMNLKRDNRRAFSGKLSANNINLGSLLGVANVGNITLKSDVNGSFGNDSISMATDANIASLRFNNYLYHDLKIKGDVNKKTFHGDIVSTDPNLAFDFRGLLDFKNAIPQYDFSLDLYSANLTKLHFNNRDSISMLSFEIDAQGSGSSLDNMNGLIHIKDMSYINHLDSVRTGDIVITGQNSDTRKYIAVNSDFLDLEFRSKMGYNTLLDYLLRSFDAYLPTLSNYTKPKKSTVNSSVDANDINNFSIVRLNVKEANNVLGIFVPGLQLASGTAFSIMVNPDANALNFSLNSDYIERGNFFVSKINLSGHNNTVGDSLSMYLTASDMYVGGFHIPGISVAAGAKNNTIKVSAGYSNTVKSHSALIGLNYSLETNQKTGMRQVRVRFNPSSFTNDDNTWRILSRDIIYDTTKLTIDNFRILGQGQELHINGVVSKNRQDTVRLALNNFNLSSLPDFMRVKGYDISGYTNGRADMISAMKEGILTANVSFDSLRVNKIDVPPVLFESIWDFSRSGANFSLSRRDTAETLVRGLYRPDKKELTAQATFSNLDLSLLNPILKGVISDTKGDVRTDLMVSLKGGKLDINGVVDGTKVSTKVDYLNVPYRINDVHVDVKNSKLSFAPTYVVDPYGNKGAFDMTLDLGSFSNIKYNLSVRPNNMLSLNTTMEQNSLFYGRVFASGLATINGDKKSINMDISASTSENSQFFMPLSDKSQVSVADFIVFETKDRIADTTDILTRKRMIFEQKQKVIKDEVKAAMSINMALEVRPNTDFQLVIDPQAGDMIKARGNGAIRLNVNPSSDEFKMYGDYEITEGFYHLRLRNITDKRFIIDPGSTIKWTGDPIDAELDIKATYKLKTSLLPLTNDPSMRRKVPVDCIITLRERLSSPRVLFDVQVPNVDPETQSLIDYAMNTQEMKAKQAIWLVTIGSFAGNDNGGFNIGSSGTGTYGYDLIFNQLSNMISSDKFSVGVHYAPRTELNSDEVSLDLQTQVFSDRLTLEFEGNYNTGNNPTMNSNNNNLSGNFAASWMIDPSGNLTAKAFTRTIERFDETQGQQEGGVGIYYKENFNKISDIVRNFRMRFSKRWREKYREDDRRRYDTKKQNVKQIEEDK